MLEEILQKGKFPSPLVIEGQNSSELLKTYVGHALCATQSYCQGCRSCKKYKTGFHPDWLQATGRIKMEELRELLYRIRQRPTETSIRILSINEFHEASVQVQNALLKTLEEPLDHWLIVLSVSSANALLPTIRSRCLLYRAPYTRSETELEDTELRIFRQMTEVDDWLLQSSMENSLKNRDQTKKLFLTLLQKASEEHYPGHWAQLAPHLEEAMEELDRNLNPKNVWEKAWVRSLP